LRRAQVSNISDDLYSKKECSILKKKKKTTAAIITKPEPLTVNETKQTYRQYCDTRKPMV